jgi:hypothetical protein
MPLALDLLLLSSFVVQALHDAAGKQLLGAEIVEDQFAVLKREENLKVEQRFRKSTLAARTGTPVIWVAFMALTLTAETRKGILCKTVVK